MGLHDFTFYDLICRNSLSYGHRPAWLEIEDGRTLDFAGYKRSVDRLARGLQRYGVRKGDRIGVIAKNSLEYFLVFGAAAALGAILLPVSWRLSAEEVCFIFNDGQPRVVFTGSEYQELCEGLRNKLDSVEAYFGLEPHGGNLPSLETLMDNQGDLEREEVSTDHGFVIIYTAAVAGRPRGALLSHGNLLWIDLLFDYILGVGSQDVHLCFLPFFHVGGIFMATSCFHAAGLNINMKRFDASEAADLIQEREVSLMMVFSPVLSSILDEQEKRGTDPGSLRAVTGIDTAETIERYQRITGGTFYSLYGQTETTGLATLGSYREKPGSAGRVLPQAQVRLVDDYDRPVVRGSVGEITVKGPMVFKGYWNLPQETAYAFREGWHHTGDLGRFDEEGFLWYAGRKAEKELIKPGGENVYPAEVEEAILRHPAVEKVVVFGVPDPKWKEGIKAVCQLKPGHSLDARELIEFVGERIARYKKPGYVEFVEELPMLENGAIDRAKVKTLYGGT